MKRIMIISLLALIAASHSMEMPLRPSASTLQSEKSHLEKLPGDLKKVILANITAKNLDEAVKNIKSLARTNKFFRDYINREDILKYIITTMADQNPDVDEHDAAEKLQTMPGIKNTQFQDWLLKRKVEIPKEQELTQAALSNDIATVERLLHEGVAVNAKDKKFKYTALALATYQKHKAMMQKLINEGADLNILNGIHAPGTALQVAAERNAKEPLEILLNAGANPNIPNAHDLSTPLMVAIEHDNVEITNLLLNAKADVNMQNKIGYTPLIKAAYVGNAQIVKMLLDAGAKINIQDNEGGNTALIWAAYRNHPKIAQLLLKAGANPNLRSSIYGTALDVARKNNNDALERLLRKYGAQESQKEPQ
jgi:ankyrin repeat protein